MSTSGAGVLEQALACTAAPVLLQGIRAGRLPDDALLLLRLAGGDQQCLVEHAKQLGVPSRKLHEAAVFYIQQVLFAPGANSYRVLGVNPEAPDARLREHYRWLVRWLHPDRNGNEWEDVYLDRVHRAWQQIRTPERRRVHDLTSEHSAYQPAVENLATRPPRVRRSRRRPVARRALPWTLLAAAAGVVVFAVVGMIWNRESGAGDGNVQALALAASPIAAVSSALDARLVLLPDRETAPDRPLTVTAATAVPPRPETHSAPAGVWPSSEAIRLSNAKPARQDVSRVVVPRVESGRVTAVESARVLVPPPHLLLAPPTLTNGSSIPAMSKVVSPGLDALVPAPVVEHGLPGPGTVAPTAAVPLQINDRVAFNLIQKFRRAYNEADLSQLMSLFTRDARLADGGDRLAIVQAFSQQFGSRQRRVISFGRPDWSATAQGAVIAANFKTAPAPQASSDRMKVSGHLRFDLRREDGQLRIFQVQHDPF